MKIEDIVSSVREALESTDDKFSMIEAIKDVLYDLSPQKTQPIDRVRWVPIDEVEPNDYNPNSVATKEMGLLYTSIKNDGYCVEESTPILMADLTWKPAKQLKEGEKIIAFDEEGTELEDGNRKQRRYRTATVLSNSIEESELLEVKTVDGSIKVTPDHPFLTKVKYCKGYYPSKWVEAKDLNQGDIVIYTMKPWDKEDSFEAGWLSGLLDADGMIAAFEKRVLTKVFVVDRTDHNNWNDMVMARVDCMTDIMRLLGMVRPLRLIESAGEFWEGRSLTSSIKGGSDSEVISVEKVDSGNIARLSTSTKTYIANGFAVHNTQPVVTIWDPVKKKYVIIDGFHRYFVCKKRSDICERNNGYLPVVVLDKTMNERMAATVRHNRARGEHSVAGMGNLVFEMLNNGWSDAKICNHLGLEPEELLKLKHITGFSALFKNVEYSKAWETKKMIKLRLEHMGHL